MVDLRNLWSDDDLPPNLGWEQTPARQGGGGRHGPADDDPDAYRTGETLGPEVIETRRPLPPRRRSIGEEDVPPAPEEIEFGDVATDAAGAMVLGEGFVRRDAA